jgi:hypothetical protein
MEGWAETLLWQGPLCCNNQLQVLKVMTQITHSIQGQYSRVPLQSLWSKPLPLLGSQKIPSFSLRERSTFEPPSPTPTPTIQHTLTYPSPQSTYTDRVPQCMSPRWNWDSPTPYPQASVPLPPPEPKGGEHTRLPVRGRGSPNSDDWRKSLALCLLCARAIP